MGHRWVGILASFKFTLEYQKGEDNGAANALSWVPIHHNYETIRSLLEGAIVGTTDQGKAEANKELFCKHVLLKNEVRVQVAKLAPMHMVDWGEAQEADAMLTACRRWLHTCRYPTSEKRCTAKEIFGQPGRHGGRACPLLCAQQPGPE